MELKNGQKNNNITLWMPSWYYKLLQHHVLSKEESQVITANTPPELIIQGCDVLYLIFNNMLLALHHTYTLHCWKVVWTLFIKKELGNPNLNKLRCIMIFEANWQLLLK